MLLFADNWNIVDQAVVFLKETFDNPLSVYLGTVVSGDPGMFFAVSVFYLIPALLVFFLGLGLPGRRHRPVRRKSVRGPRTMTERGVKAAADRGAVAWERRFCWCSSGRPSTARPGM